MERRFNAFLEHPSLLYGSDSHGLTRQERLDAVLAESVRLSCQEMDENIRASDKSGTCATSVFLLLDPASGATRVYCANVGDSRTVLFGSKLRACSERSGLDGSLHSISRSEDGSELGVSEHDGIRVTEPLPKNARNKANRSTMAYALSEDHVLSLPREKLRVQGEGGRLSLPQFWNPLPAEVIGEVSAVDPRYNSTSISKLPKGLSENLAPSTFDIGYPQTDKLSAATEFIGLLKQDPVVSDLVSILRTSYQGLNPETAEPEHHEGYLVQHQESFVDKRDPRMEKEVVFGRYNLSAMMTRTLGDKYGPRSCIPLPDISAITLGPDEFGRIVLASDGLWDVLTVEAVRKTVMKFHRPEDVAIALAQSASNLRASHGLRKDDITVLVVDVNPEVYEQTYRGYNCVLS